MNDKISIVKYESGDEKDIDPVEQTLSSHPDYQNTWNKIVHPSQTWTGIHQNKIVGVGGILPEECHAVVWVLIDKSLLAKPILMFRTLKRGLEFVERLYQGELRTYVQHGFKAACHLMTHLGFKPIGSEGNYWMYKKE